MKHQFSNRRSMAKDRKLVQMLHTLGNPVDPDLQRAISLVRSGRASLPPDASIEELIEALHDEELSVRADAAHRLGTMGKYVPIEPLLQALGDEQRFVRAQAARALGMIGRDVLIVPLIAALGDNDGSVRVAAAEALGMLGKSVLYEDLTPALNDPWPPVREAATLALGKLEQSVPEEIFAVVLQDEDQVVRTAANTVVEMLKRQASIKPLESARRSVPKPEHEVATQTEEHPPLEITLKMRNWPPTRLIAALLRRSPWVVLTSAGKGLPKAVASGSAHYQAKGTKQKTKSGIIYLIAGQLTQLQMLDWAKQNKIAVMTVFTIASTALMLSKKEGIRSKVKRNTSRLFQLPRTFIGKYIKLHKANTTHP